MDFIMMGRFQMRSSSTPWKPQWTSLVPRDPKSPVIVRPRSHVAAPFPLLGPYLTTPPTFPREGPAPKISGSSLLTSSTPRGVRAAPLTCNLWFEIFANSTSQSHQDPKIFSLGTSHCTHTDPLQVLGPAQKSKYEFCLQMWAVVQIVEDVDEYWVSRRNTHPIALQTF